MRLGREAEERRDRQFLRGNLGEISAPDLLQIVAFLKLGDVRIVLDSGSEEGRIALADGQLAHAELKELSGTKALFRLLGWTRGTFCVEHAAFAGTRTLSGRIDRMLATGLAHHDEYRALRRRVTEGGSYFLVQRDPALLTRRFEETSASVLALIEKHHLLDEVLDRSPLPDLDVVRILSELLQTEVVAARSARSARGRPSSRTSARGTFRDERS
jgi:hypothetical protein